jgi:hypothetical protein
LAFFEKSRVEAEGVILGTENKGGVIDRTKWAASELLQSLPELRPFNGASRLIGFERKRKRNVRFTAITALSRGTAISSSAMITTRTIAAQCTADVLEPPGRLGPATPPPSEAFF